MILGSVIFVGNLVTSRRIVTRCSKRIKTGIEMRKEVKTKNLHTLRIDMMVLESS